jgi:catechol 2,3-dioxygenase-like lactoylglutathione lyase family enzyme
MQLEGIDHVALGVRDIERSVKWYTEVLGFERLHEGMWNGVPTFIGKGNTGIALFPASRDAKSIRSTPEGQPIAPIGWVAQLLHVMSPRSGFGLVRRSCPAPPGSATSSSHRELRMLHLAFRANRENFLAAQHELEKRGIKFEFQDHEISHSIYFRDPDGHLLEITTYELDG